MGSLARKLQLKPDDERAVFSADVLDGLTTSPKRLLPKYFYDDTGIAGVLSDALRDEHTA
jgi:uncharacterized SAM-dependent methyltransferase